MSNIKKRLSESDLNTVLSETKLPPKKRFKTWKIVNEGSLPPEPKQHVEADLAEVALKMKAIQTSISRSNSFKSELLSKVGKKLGLLTPPRVKQDLNTKVREVLWRRCEMMKKHRAHVIKFIENLKKVGKSQYFHRPLAQDFPAEFAGWKKLRRQRGLAKSESERALILFHFDYFIHQVRNEEWLKPMSDKEVESLDFVFSGQVIGDVNFSREDKAFFQIDLYRIEECLTKWFQGAREMFCFYVEVQIESGNELKQLEGNKKVVFVDAFFERFKFLFANMKQKLSKDLEKLLIEEQLDRVDKENKEPALKSWRKIPEKPRSFEIIKDYTIVEGLAAQEIQRIKLAFSATDFTSSGEYLSTKWVLPEGLNDDDLSNEQEFVNSRSRQSQAHSSEVDPWEPCLVDEDIKVLETWGIDCWVRKNISLALETVPQSFRMTPPQVNWFIEGILLRAVTLQAHDKAHNIAVTLNHIAAEAQQKKLNAMESMRVSKSRGIKGKESEEELAAFYESRFGKRQRGHKVAEEVVGQMVKVYMTKLLHWASGHISGYSGKTYKHEISFDDGSKQWINLSKARVNFPNLQSSKYDKDITPDMIIQAVQALIKCHSNWHPLGFAIHPKGLGVIAQIPLFKGEYIGSYIGNIYPPWLWDSKERAEDQLRQQKGIKLPDFWNIRFERPKSCADGYDIYYVDAKHKGSVMSRLNHSCSPNCTVMMMRKGNATNPSFVVAVRAARNIEVGEELTIDYNCVTDSVDEFRAAVCLCGSNSCRGSFLYLTANNQFMQVVNRRHRIGHRLAMLVEACLPLPVSHHAKRDFSSQLKARLFGTSKDSQVQLIGEANLTRLVQHRLGRLVLEDFPAWLARYLSLCLRFADIECLELPSRIFATEKKRRAAVHRKQKLSKEFKFEEQKAYEFSKLQANGVLAQREANLVVTAGKVRSRILRRLEAGRSKSELVTEEMTDIMFAEDQFETNSDLDICRFVLADIIGLVEVSTQPNQRFLRNKSKLPKSVNKAKRRQVKVADLTRNAHENGRRRRYWVGDRVLARWCADDYKMYPGWYSATVLAVHPPVSRRVTFLDESSGEAADSTREQVKLVLSEMIFKLETYEEIEDTKDYMKREGLENIAVNEVSKRWKGSSIHILYDTGEVDRIPLNQSFVYRPGISQLTLIGSCRTGLTLSAHQPPLRVLNKLEVLYCFVKDKTRSFLSRLLVLLESKLGKFVPLWQQSIKSIRSAYGPNRHLPFWWNVKTNEVRIHKPQEQDDTNNLIWYIPSALIKLKHYATYAASEATTLEEGLEILKHVRSMILEMPLPKLTYVSQQESERLSNTLQLTSDVLTLMLHTHTFFTVTEPRVFDTSYTGVQSQQYSYQQKSVVSALLGWLDQKDDNLDIHELTGIAFVPNIEACFDLNSSNEKHKLKYISSSRKELLEHLEHKDNRYNIWPKNVVHTFCNNIPELSFDLENKYAQDKESKKGTLWPPPAPPIMLFGSPVIDAAKYDNLDLKRLSTKLTGKVKDTHSKELLNSLKKPLSHKSRQVFIDLLADLKLYVRNTKIADWIVPPELSNETQKKLESMQYSNAHNSGDLVKLSQEVLAALSRHDPIKSCLNGMVQQIESKHLLMHNKENPLFPYFFEHFKDSLRLDFLQIKTLWSKLDHQERVLWGKQCQQRRKLLRSGYLRQ